MTTDIGPGDVVSARAPATYNDAPIPPGTRTVVVALGPDGQRTEPHCCKLARRPDRGLVLKDFPMGDDSTWCPCVWRKIGGSQADTVARFRESLNVRSPGKVVA